MTFREHGDRHRAAELGTDSEITAQAWPAQLSRRTCVGSIRDARYAGSQPAIAPTTVKADRKSVV